VSASLPHFGERLRRSPASPCSIEASPSPKRTMPILRLGATTCKFLVDWMIATQRQLGNGMTCAFTYTHTNTIAHTTLARRQTDWRGRHCLKLMHSFSRNTLIYMMRTMYRGQHFHHSTGHLCHVSSIKNHSMPCFGNPLFSPLPFVSMHQHFKL
jgi:hypothetical protein